MTMVSTANRVNYTATAGQVNFDYTFPCFDKTHMQVYSGSVLKTVDVDYTIDLTLKRVTFAVAPGEGVSVILIRVVPKTQLIDYVAHDAFPAETHERALDLLTMLSQQDSEVFGRCIKLNLFSSFKDIYFPEPSGTGKFIRWNDAGDGLQLADVITANYTIPWYDIKDYPDLNSAVSAIGASTVTLLIAQNTYLNANLTVPLNINLVITKTGKITRVGTSTLLISGHFSAGINKIFYGFNAGDVTLGAGAVSEVYPEWWEDNATPGTTDMTVAIKSAIFASAGSPIRLLNTDYMTSTEILIDTDGTHINGSGANTTRILFKPLAGATCINLYKSTGLLSEVTIKDLKLVTEDAYGDFTKIGISLRNVSRVTLDNIGISGWFGNDSSIGLQTKGRELTTIRNIYIYADIPVSIENNPDYASIDCDHFHFENTYFVAAANTGSVIKVESGVFISNLLVDGYNAWIPLGDGHGWEWNDSSSAGTSQNLSFKNIRFEQTAAPTKYCFYFERTGTSRVQNIIFENIHAGLNNTKGWYIRKATNVVFKNCYYPNSSNNEALNVDAATYFITIQGCFWQANTTATMTGQNLLFALWGYCGPLPVTGFYSSLADINSLFGVYTQDIYPAVNNTYYLGKNSATTPRAWKGVIVKDVSNGHYYRIQVSAGTLGIADLGT